MVGLIQLAAGVVLRVRTDATIAKLDESFAKDPLRTRNDELVRILRSHDSIRRAWPQVYLSAVKP